MTNKQRL